MVAKDQQDLRDLDQDDNAAIDVEVVDEDEAEEDGGCNVQGLGDFAAHCNVKNVLELSSRGKRNTNLN